MCLQLIAKKLIIFFVLFTASEEILSPAKQGLD